MRAAQWRIVRQAAVMAGVVGVFGVSFGVLAVAAGLPPLMACAMSLGVFAGGAQFAAVGVLALGGSPVAAVASGLLLNSRYVAFGLAVAERLRHRLGRARGVRGHLLRATIGQLVIDESSALALAQDSDEEAERAFWWAGLAVFVLWNAGTAVGAFAGAAVDPEVLGLDGALAALFLALVFPLVDTPQRRRAAGAGAVIAVALVPVAPPGVPIIVAGLGVVAAMVPGNRTSEGSR